MRLSFLVMDKGKLPIKFSYRLCFLDPNGIAFKPDPMDQQTHYHLFNLANHQSTNKSHLLETKINPP
jgi:hypothetical protein